MELDTAFVTVVVDNETDTLSSARPGPTILLGDLNTRADTATMDALAAPGLHPVNAGAGTFLADDPTTQIDWVLHTGDLAATGVGVVTTASSDHLPVVAVLEKRPRPAT